MSLALLATDSAAAVATSSLAGESPEPPHPGSALVSAVVTSVSFNKVRIRAFMWLPVLVKKPDRPNALEQGGRARGCIRSVGLRSNIVVVAIWLAFRLPVLLVPASAMSFAVSM